MSAHFCQKTGVRIAAPGLSEIVDPLAGQPVVEPPAPPPGRMTLEEQERLARELEEAKTRETVLQRQADAALLRTAEDWQERLDRAVESLTAEHALAMENLKAEHAAELARLREQHTAELDALTRPAEPPAPTADDQTGPVQEEPPTADAVPKPHRRGGNR